MKFREFMNENVRDFVDTYKKTLVGVPQDPSHHPEGDVYNHVRLVRKAVEKGISIIQSYKADPEIGPILADIDLSITPEEKQVLFLAAWMHDLGKTTATTIDQVPFRQATGPGKIQALGHEDPEHYGPQIEKLRKVAPPKVVDFYEKHKPIINFLIERHMDFAQGGFSKLFLTDNFVEGRLKNDPKLKLLLMLMWADRMGRTPEAINLDNNKAKLIEASKKSIKRAANLANQSKPFEGGPDEMRAMMAAKGIPSNVIEKAVRSKFGL